MASPLDLCMIPSNQQNKENLKKSNALQSESINQINQVHSLPVDQTHLLLTKENTLDDIYYYTIGSEKNEMIYGFKLKDNISNRNVSLYLFCESVKRSISYVQNATHKINYVELFFINRSDNIDSNDGRYDVICKKYKIPDIMKISEDWIITECNILSKNSNNSVNLKNLIDLGYASPDIRIESTSTHLCEIELIHKFIISGSYKDSCVIQ